MDPELRASLLAGLVGGAIALLGFAGLHALLVSPRIALFLVAGGALPAALGGILAGWAYHEATAALEPPVRGWGLGVMLWLPTVPAGGLGALQPSAGLLVGVPFGLLLAAGLGWFTERTPRGALAVLLAALLPALMVAAGASIVGGGVRELLLLGAMLPILLAAGRGLQAVRPHLRRDARPVEVASR